VHPGTLTYTRIYTKVLIRVYKHKLPNCPTYQRTYCDSSLEASFLSRPFFFTLLSSAFFFPCDQCVLMQRGPAQGHGFARPVPSNTHTKLACISASKKGGLPLYFHPTNTCLDSLLQLRSKRATVTRVGAREGMQFTMNSWFHPFRNSCKDALALCQERGAPGACDRESAAKGTWIDHVAICTKAALHELVSVELTEDQQHIMQDQQRIKPLNGLPDAAKRYCCTTACTGLA